ncbi:polyprenyl synthetase family protein [Mangrovibrevibacter kandeliae]|uniref:polyprenyl synthetase family protein n=1 Tax=Mangrovibrevibacter kandeliae TaxID=2968473 RepID=UPI002118E129|nr:farnesyl diphosphate synthase [Aurantimonas sp. CSK15Z-1]MCQ8780627.1 polyprenyl synthetase family protein [Aurantimonas sp. CSK15Z-1]
MNQSALETKLDDVAKAVGSVLDDVLGSHQLVAGTPHRLLNAMRHGVLNGGKRLRPFLVVEAAKLFGADARSALQIGAALECIHSYSLIHDDLPAMDDDDLRRGQPTVHKAYDEATAILAGDALLTLGFGMVGAMESLAPQIRVKLVAMLAKRAGAPGMVGGQMLDVATPTHRQSELEITRMQAMKTGALIAFACEAGAVVADAPDEDRKRLRRFGEICGLAFQLADDLLDETGDATSLGKATGKDQARGKQTLSALHGRDWAVQRLDALVGEAEEVLAPYGDKAATLLEAMRFVAWRQR